jgi:tetratricopeptide (TPR) repeat protein
MCDGHFNCAQSFAKLEPMTFEQPASSNQGRESDTPTTEPDKTSRRRLWFRVVAVLLPLVLLGATEAGLRVAGYGYPTSFFLKIRQGGESVLVENSRFGWRFFPPSLARTPQPLRLALKKPPRTIRIIVFGESAAMGDPEPAYGFGRQIQRLLTARHHDQRFEVINVAMTAINSHVIRAIASDCVRVQGDIWLVYAGNNEVLGPFGAGTVFGAQSPRLSTVRALLAAKQFRLGQLVAGLRSDGNEPKEWKGLELFLHNEVSQRDLRLKRVYDNFEANLNSIAELGQSSGAKVILSTVPVNLKDCPPFASLHSPGLGPDSLKRFDEQLTLSREAESAGKFAEALSACEQAGRLDDQFAEVVFRRARCELALGQTNAADADFGLARDLDALRFRADSRLNELVRGVASRHGDLVDTERQLSLEAPDRLPGDDFFYDHVHPNFSGNYAIARLLAPEIEKQLSLTTGQSATWLTEAEMAHQLAYTDFDRRRIGEEMRLRLQQPPFNSQSNFQERDRTWRQRLGAIGTSPEDSIWEYRAALALVPDDWVMRENFGRLLESIGDTSGAAEQWSQVSQALPHEPDSFFHLGNLAFDQGAYDRATEEFQKALQLRPRSLEALSGLGLVFAAQGSTNAAMAEFDQALRIYPSYCAARVNRAVLLASSGNAQGAIEEYKTVLQIDVNNVAARINLAKLLFGHGQSDQAIQLYQQALVLRPDNPIARFDLANALAALERHPEALTNYMAAVEIQPTFADAQYNLALELARAGRLSDALPHFSEAVRLRPAAPETHFNYGVALAKARRYTDAAQQFQETIKLQPNYPSAQELLNKSQQLSSGPLLP